MESSSLGLSFVGVVHTKASTRTRASSGKFLRLPRLVSPPFPSRPPLHLVSERPCGLPHECSGRQQRRRISAQGFKNRDPHNIPHLIVASHGHFLQQLK